MCRIEDNFNFNIYSQFFVKNVDLQFQKRLSNFLKFTKSQLRWRKMLVLGQSNLIVCVNRKLVLCDYIHLSGRRLVQAVYLVLKILLIQREIITLSLFGYFNVFNTIYIMGYLKFTISTYLGCKNKIRRNSSSTTIVLIQIQ